MGPTASFAFTTRVPPDTVRKYVRDLVVTPQEWDFGSCGETTRLLRGCAAGPRLVEQDDPGALRLSSRARGLRVDETFLFLSVGRNTRVEYSLRSELSGCACVLAPLLGARARACAEAAARRMRDHLLLLEALCE